MKIFNHFITVNIFLSMVLLPLYFPSNLCAQQSPIPKFFGLYAVDNGKLIELKEAIKEGRTRLLGHLGSNNAAGITSLSGISASKNVEFILFKDVRPVRVAIAKLKFAKGATIQGVTPGDSGKNLVDHWFAYQKGEGDPGPADLWMIDEDIPTRLGPLEGKQNMTLVAPARPLTDGVYMFYAYVPTVSETFEGALIQARGGTQSAWFCDLVVGSPGRTETKQEIPVHPRESNIKEDIKMKNQLVKPADKEQTRGVAADLESQPPTMATVRKAKKAQGLNGYIFQDRNSKKFFLEDSDGNKYKFEGGQWLKLGGQEPSVKAEEKVQAPRQALAQAKEAASGPPTIDTVRKAKKAQGLNGHIFQDRNSGKWFLEDSDDNTYKFEGGQWKKIN